MRRFIVYAGLTVAVSIAAFDTAHAYAPGPPTLRMLRSQRGLHQRFSVAGGCTPGVRLFDRSLDGVAGRVGPDLCHRETDGLLDYLPG